MIGTFNPQEIIEPVEGMPWLLNDCLQQLIGQPFLFFRETYPEELTVHFGTPMQRAIPKLKDRPRGSFVLSVSGSAWHIASGENGSGWFTRSGVIDQNSRSTGTTLTVMEKQQIVRPGSVVIGVETYIASEVPGFGLIVDFSDRSRMVLKPTPDHDVNDGEELLPDWELLTPNARFLQAGPGLKWAYTPSDQPRKSLT